MIDYFRFNGLATRSEFWGVAVVGMAAMIALALVLGFISGSGGPGSAGEAFGAIGLLIAIVGGAWLSIATCIRRCRDAGINLWWTLGTIVPYIGWVVFIVLGCLPSDTNADPSVFE